MSQIEHAIFPLRGSFDSAGLVGSLLEFGFADKENVCRHKNSNERPVELDDLLVAIRNVRLDHEEIDERNGAGSHRRFSMGRVTIRIAWPNTMVSRNPSASFGTTPSAINAAGKCT